MPRPTLKDVSARAGVSVATASAVVNRAGWVTEATRERVQAAIDALGYRPNRAARALRTRREGTVGVVVSALSDPFQSAFVRALSQALHGGGRSLFLSDADGDAALGDSLVDSLVERSVDGLVVGASVVSPARLAALAGGSVPAVVAGETDVAGLPSVGSDLAAGAAQATAYLRDRGARRVALVTAPSPQADLLRAGWRSVQADDALDLGAGALADLWALGADAVLAGSDALAAEVVQSARDAGRSVPGDVQVIAVGNGPLAPLVRPALTSVSLDAPAVAAAALSALDAGGSALVPTRLVPRASTLP
ncbi:LacI family DNA-binding transcriptional regulator [Rubrivirga sp.]|uniref:LacI family DNA-binding transcriptional regulator n=1 Tax=Rubrivirga sp. TaxID=1885344 RepID=UPI003B51BE74